MQKAYLKLTTFLSVQILGWIKYMMIGKNGRVPRKDGQDEN
jgi:hypothetical protein